MNLNQAQLLLTTQGLNSERSKEILIESGLLASENAIQAELLESTLLKAGLNKEEREEILNKLGLIQYEGAEAIVQGTCTKADLEAVLAQKLKNAEDAEGIIKALGLAGANTITTASFGLLTKSIWANIKAMLVWLVTTPTGVFTLIVGGLTAATLAVTKYNEKLEENRQEMIEAGKEASQLNKDLDGLVEQYRKLGEDGKFDNSDREQAKNIQQQINDLLGDEALKVNLVNGNYEEQLKLLRKIQHEKAKDNYKTIKDAKVAAEDSLLAITPKVTSGSNNTADESKAIKQVLKDYGFDKYIGTSENDNSASQIIHFAIDNSSAESTIQSLEDMKELRDVLRKSYEDEISTGGDLEDFYNNLDKKIGELSEAVTKYKDALSDYNINEAVIQFNETEFDGITGALIRNEDQLKKWLNSMLTSKDISDGVKQELLGLASTYFPDMSDAVGEATKEYIKNRVAAGGDITSLRNLASTCGITEQAFDDLVFATTLFNNKEIDVDSKIAKLRELGYELDVVNTKMNGYYVKTGSGGQYVGDMQIETIDGKRYAVYYDNHNEVIKKELLTKEYGDDGGDKPPYSPTDGDKGKDNKPDYEDPTDAIINRINLRAKELEQEEQSIQNAIEIAELENDYKKQISLTNDKLDTQKQKVDALKIANNELHQMAENLRNSTPQWNEESWFNSQGQATEAYNTLYNNSSKEEQEKLKDQFEKISKIKEAWVENDEKRLEITKEILQTEEGLVNLDFENSQEWIDERNRLNDWQLFDDNEIAAWERVIKRLKEDYKDCAGAAEKIKEAEQNLFEARQQLIEDVFDAIEKIYDLDINRLNSKSTLLSSHYELINAINEEQHNLNKELAESEIAGAKMNEIERETLFTKEEHAKLSEKLTSIMNDANNIQSDYLADLETATEDTIEEITNNYERQYELKLKEYEIVKAELNLAKAQQRLENVENEKSVRTWNGTNWVYEANLQDVIDARNEVEDAKYELQRAQTENLQEIALNKLDEEADKLETEKNKLATTLDEISGKTKLSGEELADALKYISENDLPIFEKIIQKVGRHLESLLGDNTYKDRFSGLDASSYATTISKMKANSEKWHTASKSEQEALHKANADYADSIGADYDDATGTWKDKNGNRLYANGTKNAKSGWGMFDENGIGSEFILTNEGIMHQFDGGEMVFSPKMKKTLWAIAQNGVVPRYTMSDFGGLTSVDNSVRTTSSDTYYSINGVNIKPEEDVSIKGFVNYLKKKF